MTRHVSEPDWAGTVVSLPLFVIAQSWLVGTAGTDCT